jgi:hypothetical protein
MILQLPIILELQTGPKADWPIVILAGDGVLQRAALRVALDADVVCLHEIETQWINNIRSRRPSNV